MCICGKHTYYTVYQFRPFVSLSLEEELMVKTKCVPTWSQCKRTMLVQREE